MTDTTITWNMNCIETNLKKGSKGDKVKQLQTFLKSKGWYTRSIDGIYGTYTVKAVKKLQQAYNLKQDGIFGSVSCKKVTEILKKDTTITTKEKSTVKNKNNTSRVLSVNEYENNENLNAKIILLAKRVSPPRTEVIDTGSMTAMTDENMQKATGTDTDSTDTDSTDTDSTDTDSTDTDSTDTDSTVETTKITDISQIKYVDPFKDEKKWKEYTITDIYELNISDDLSDLSHEATFKVIYSDDLFKQLAKYRACKLELNRQGSTQYILEGFITECSRLQENNLPIINVTINGFHSYLDQQVEFNASDKKSVLLKALCDMTGLKLDLDLTGLTDNTYELKTGSSTSNSENSEGTTTGDDTTKRAEIFKKAATWSYGGASYQDPEEAYKWTEAHKCGDCFCASASLFYQFKTFTNYGVRIVVGYSPYAGSRTHRTIQLKENGQWVDPPEYKQMTRNLRVLSRYPRHTFNNYIRE